MMLTIFNKDVRQLAKGMAQADWKTELPPPFK